VLLIDELGNVGVAVFRVRSRRDRWPCPRVPEYAGLRCLTDPSLSPPGEYEGGLVKTTAPALEVEAIEPIHVVLLSYDQHSTTSIRVGVSCCRARAAC
jgi:hypothetical protein